MTTITLSSYNLPPGEYMVWMHRDNGTSRLLGTATRTTYGKWQLAIDTGRGTQFRDDFDRLADARAKARHMWGIPEPLDTAAKRYRASIIAEPMRGGLIRPAWEDLTDEAKRKWEAGA